MKTVKVPKACQTQVTLIPKEMMEGIKVTDKQLQMFAKILGNKYIDIVIPLSEPEQIIEGCPIDHESEQAIEHSIY